MGHLYTTPALRLHTKAHTGYTTRQCIYSPRYIQYALRHVVFCYSFAWMSIRTLSFNADMFFFFLFFPPFKCVFIANISDILIFSFFFSSSRIIVSFFFFFLVKRKKRSKLLNDIDTFSHNFVRSIRKKNDSLENESRAVFDSLRYSIGGKKFLG